MCAREAARHELDLILWQQARREVTAELLGLPIDQVTRRDLLLANLRFGRPPLAHQAPAPRWHREAQYHRGRRSGGTRSRSRADEYHQVPPILTGAVLM
jgi:hypothetical protein